MAITASQLSKSGARGKEMDNLVREQLQIIDDKLTHASRVWGRNVLIYELPTQYPFQGLSKQDAQRIAYCAILRSLEKRGFEVRLQLERRPERSILYVAWNTDLDLEEVKAMNELIVKLRIESKDVPAFMQPRELAARKKALETPSPASGAAGGPPLEAGVTDAEMALLTS